MTIAAVALYDRIQVELVESRRRRDSLTLDTLSLLKSELVKASKETAARGTIDDELVVRLARKEVKRREEAIEVYRKAGRVEAARREEAFLFPHAMRKDTFEVSQVPHRRRSSQLAWTRSAAPGHRRSP